MQCTRVLTVSNVMHMCLHVRMHVYMHVFANTRPIAAFAHVRTGKCVCMCAHMYIIYMRVSMHVCLLI